MTSPSLKIDTSVALASQSHHANTNSQSHSPGSAPLPDTSPQDPSPTTSALTLMSATASSADASTYSLILPQASIYSETTVDTHLSADMSPSEGSQPEYVLAMHDYIPEQRNATCLAFRAGQVIRVLNRDSSGWWDGELDGSRGWFPSNYVNGDLALLADDQLPQFISVRAFYLFIYSLFWSQSSNLRVCITAKANTAFSIPFADLSHISHQYPFVSAESLLSR